MNRCGYTRTAEPERAIRAAQGNPNAMFLAGGTTLVDLMKEHVLHPDELIDINHLPFGKLEPLPGGGLRIGALVTNSELAEHVERSHPVLAQAIMSGASEQVRNMATTGGNLLQRTRCPYFRDPAAPCNKREPGSGCSALDGFNRSHAVLGGSQSCVATHPSDMAVALIALDAVLALRGPSGQRKVPLSEFYLLPQSTPHKENVLQRGELIEAVELPPLEGRSRYLKVRDRASFEFALASAAVVLQVSGGVVQRARVALGGVATRPWRSPDAEQILVGSAPTRARFKEAAASALEGASALRHNAFKVELARRTRVRALEEVS
jgi:xanthine dehydrogenase YagS FAD-binding subunit